MVQTLLVSGAAFCFSIVPALLEQPFPIFSTLGLSEMFALVWYGLVITALSFVFFYAGAKRCSAYTIASFSGVMPLTSMFLSVLFLHEQIGLSQWCGGLLVISGMLLIGKRFTRQGVRYIPGINGKDGL